MILDNTDKRILQILEVNARISLKELGARINMSSTAAGERIKKLEEAGIIDGYSARLDREELGLSVHAIIVIEFPYTLRESQGSFMDYLKKADFITSAYPVYTSGVDYVLECYCRDMKEFQELQAELVDFGFTTTYIIGKDMVYSLRNEIDED